MTSAAIRTVTLNGDPTRAQAELLPDLLCEWGYDPKQQGIAVAVNLAVVPRSEWNRTRIADGDQIDIVGAKQGG